LSVLRGAVALFLGAWVGAAAFFSLVAAPALFRGLSRAEAARAVGVLFPVYYPFTAACGLLALVLAIAAWTRGRRRRGMAVALAAAGVAWLLTLYGGYVLLPRIDALQARVPDLLALPAGDPLRVNFGRLHGASVALNLVALMLAAVAFLAWTGSG
ncbi:MAG: DUF4149 domain-containing protein, partial [Clostridia bacterium]|nr:DUF4149 domain-containing protein [Clostridia bacterium]